MSKNEGKGMTRREALLAAGTMAAGAALSSVVPVAKAQAATPAPLRRPKGRHGGPELEGGLLHQLPDGVGEQHRPGTRLVQDRLQGQGHRLLVLPQPPRDRLVSALHPQPGEPDPLRRAVSPDPRPGRHPQDPAARLHLGLRRRLHGRARRRPDPSDVGSQGEANRPLQEPEHHQERLVAHPGAHGNRQHAHAARHDHEGRADRRVPLRRRLVRQARR